jgi:hypothetical protein
MKRILVGICALPVFLGLGGVGVAHAASAPAPVAMSVNAPAPDNGAADPHVARVGTAPTHAPLGLAVVTPPNYHWNASVITSGECNFREICNVWTHLGSGKRTDSALGWLHAFGVIYAAKACIDFWATPADNSVLGWTFIGRTQVTAAGSWVPLSDLGFNYKYIIHNGATCP